jgi:hypothetical protein
LRAGGRGGGALPKVCGPAGLHGVLAAGGSKRVRDSVVHGKSPLTPAAAALLLIRVDTSGPRHETTPLHGPGGPRRTVGGRSSTLGDTDSTGGLSSIPRSTSTSMIDLRRVPYDDRLAAIDAGATARPASVFGGVDCPVRGATLSRAPGRPGGAGPFGATVCLRRASMVARFGEVCSAIAFPNKPRGYPVRRTRRSEECLFGDGS